MQEGPPDRAHASAPDLRPVGRTAICHGLLLSHPGFDQTASSEDPAGPRSGVATFIRNGSGITPAGEGTSARCSLDEMALPCAPPFCRRHQRSFGRPSSSCEPPWQRLLVRKNANALSAAPRFAPAATSLPTRDHARSANGPSHSNSSSHPLNPTRLLRLRLSQPRRLHPLQTGRALRAQALTTPIRSSLHWEKPRVSRSSVGGPGLTAPGAPRSP
jgi:hypothetical protein